MARFTIAYVEDSSADADLLKRALLQMLPRAELLHFRDAETAQEFLAEAAQRSYQVHLAIVDIKLPGIQGDRLISWIRQQTAFLHLPIIALSGAAVFDNLADAQSIGANSFLIKPVVYNDYIDLVYLIQEHCDAGPA